MDLVPGGGEKTPKNVNLKTPKRFGEQFRQKMDNPSTLMHL